MLVLGKEKPTIFFKAKQKQKSGNPCKGKESEFRTYHVIRFKFPIFKQKSQGKPRNKKVWSAPPKEKKKINQQKLFQRMIG